MKLVVRKVKNCAAVEAAHLLAHHCKPLFIFRLCGHDGHVSKSYGEKNALQSHCQCPPQLISALHEDFSKAPIRFLPLACPSLPALGPALELLSTKLGNRFLQTWVPRSPGHILVAANLVPTCCIHLPLDTP